MKRLFFAGAALALFACARSSSDTGQTGQAAAALSFPDGNNGGYSAANGASLNCSSSKVTVNVCTGAPPGSLASATRTELSMPLRVVANGDGAEVTLTLFRAPGMDDATFARDQGMVEKDLAKLKKLLGT